MLIAEAWAFFFGCLHWSLFLRIMSFLGFCGGGGVRPDGLVFFDGEGWGLETSDPSFFLDFCIALLLRLVF